MAERIAVYGAVADSLAVRAKEVREAIDDASLTGDADIADLYTGISRTLDKLLWVVEVQVE